MRDAAPHMETLRQSLTEEEELRAARYRVAGRGDRFVVARAVLRWTLGRATGIEPGAVHFSYGSNGKPYLAGGGPRFNASDSGDYVVVALATDEIGIDLEILRPMARRDGLAKRICTDREFAAFASLPEEQKNGALLRLWTCKEAGLKAVGTGLTGGVRNVEIDFGPDQDFRLRRLLDHHNGWSLIPIDVHETIICTAIIRGTDWSVVRRSAETLFA